MNLLAIDTTGADCAVALRTAGRPDIVRVETIGRGHAERLAPMVAEVLDEAGLAPARLDRVGVTIGPGSFAGTRVATAFGRGLALATRAVAMGFSNLEVLAAQHADDRPLGVVHDARRGELVFQAWSGDGPVSEPQRSDRAGAAGQLAALLGPSGKLVGSGASLLDQAAFSVLGSPPLSMSVLLDLVATADPSRHPPSPFCARPPDAKLPGGVDPA